MKLKQILDYSSILLAAAGVSALLIGCETGLGGHLCKGNVGLQLYSLRAQMGKDVPGTLAEVHSWGIKYLELAGTYNVPPAQFKEDLTQHGLVAVSAHFPFERFRDDADALFKEAESLGVKYVGCAGIPHQGAFDEVVCRQAIAVFNRAGEMAAKHHMTFFYHPHGFEFQPYGNETLCDLLIKETNPKYVKYEMDIFWIAHPGQDPVQWLERYPGRWELMHLKDMKKGTPTGLLTGSSPVSNDVPLGSGQLDIPAILRAAGRVGVKWYFIEDESEISEQQIPETLRYLREAR